MIIEGKANRPQPEPEDKRKLLEFNTPEKTSRIPLYFALIVTGIAAFLKSAFAAQARDNPPAPAEDLPAEDDGATFSVRVVAGEVGIDEVMAGDDGRDAASGGGGSDWNSSGLSLTDPMSFNYAATHFEYLGPQVAAFFPAAFNYQPQNDNVAPQRGSFASRASGLSAPDVSVSAQPSVDEDETRPDGDDDDDEGEDDDDDETANRAPVVVGPVRLREMFAGQVVLIGLAELLSGASDPDGDVLTINDITTTGGIVARVGAGWSFVTLPGMFGIITFTYTISDGLLAVVQTATLDVTQNTVLLTPWDDVFVATPWDDNIDGLAGDDIIDARAGNDIASGGSGFDHISGGAGDDQLFGGLDGDVIFGGGGDDVIGGGGGDDRLFGEAGNDIVDGGDGNDVLEGNEGDDVLIGGAGDDSVSGNAGDDVIEGNDGDDQLAGGAGKDAIDGGDGHDTMSGEAGDDLLSGGDGGDTMSGGEGDDEIAAGAGDDAITGDAGQDRIDGGDGHDTLDYSEFSVDIQLDFEAGMAWSAEIGEDLYENVEAVIGGQGDDTLIFCETTAIITGGPGDDLFIFTVSEETPVLSRQLMFEILDFVVGDRVHVADYALSSRAQQLEEERFGEIYDELQAGFEASLPIRVTHAYYDDADHTVIEADVDRNDFYEISITLKGVQLPMLIEHQVG